MFFFLLGKLLTWKQNAAIYSNAVRPLNAHYGITRARDGMAAFLITYAFGCELWAPWSEEFGRWPIMQLSLGFINLWQPLAGASTRWDMVLASRVLGGFSTAGGSVTCKFPFECTPAGVWSGRPSGRVYARACLVATRFRHYFPRQVLSGVTMLTVPSGHGGRHVRPR